MSYTATGLHESTNEKYPSKCTICDLPDHRIIRKELTQAPTPSLPTSPIQYGIDRGVTVELVDLSHLASCALDYFKHSSGWTGSEYHLKWKALQGALMKRFPSHFPGVADNSDVLVGGKWRPSDTPSAEYKADVIKQLSEKDKVIKDLQLSLKICRETITEKRVAASGFTVTLMESDSEPGERTW